MLTAMNIAIRHIAIVVLGAVASAAFAAPVTEDVVAELT
jgi:hypothetical protein